MSAHPDWLRDLLSQLREFWPLDRPLNVVLQDDGFWQHHGYPDSTDGLCQIQPDLITIHIRDTAEDTNYWRGVVIHEYAHAILAPLTESADQSPEYVRAVEKHVWRLGGTIAFLLGTAAVTAERDELQQVNHALRREPPTGEVVVTSAGGREWHYTQGGQVEYLDEDD